MSARTPGPWTHCLKAVMVDEADRSNYTISDRDGSYECEIRTELGELIACAYANGERSAVERAAFIVDACNANKRVGGHSAPYVRNPKASENTTDASIPHYDALTTENAALRESIALALEEIRLGRAAVGNCLNADLALRTTCERARNALIGQPNSPESDKARAALAQGK